MSLKYCKSCGWMLPPNKCQLLKVYMNPEEDFCSKHRMKIPVCDICGQPINKNGILDSDSKSTHLICQSCLVAIKTCRLCDNINFCSFETDPSPLPKQIQQQVQQGPYQFVSTVRNPERVRITCQNGCKCFDEENGCLRQITQTCKNQIYTYKED